MSTNAMTNLLKDVKPYKTGWRVRVKMLHSWKQNFGGETLEFILADETGGKIHSSCKRSQMFRVQKGLPIGEWRFVENFIVSQAGGQYRPTNLQYKMTVTGDTVITKSDLQDNNQFLDLASYEDIIEGKLNPYFLIDIIGQPIDIGDIQVVPLQGKETKKLELTLRDTNDQQIACCLWGRFAEQLLFTYKVGQVNKSFLCLLRFAKINVNKGQVQITNAFQISTIVINPPGFDVQDYLTLMPINDLSLTTGSLEVVKPNGKKRTPDKWSLYPEKTILDIIMATEVDKCIVTATVYAIDTDWAWYYFSCVKCHFKKVTDIPKKEVLPVKQLWYCDTCKHSVINVAPKFQLHLLIKDDTGESKVLLLDTVAEPILGVSAEVLLGDSLEEVEDPEDLPNAITDLIGKTFKFGVYVGKDNVDYGSHIFHVGKTWAANEIISQSDDENTEDTLTNFISSDRSSVQVSFGSNQSEDTTCLSSTPLSKRKVDNEIEELSSTSKKKCSKIIKVEKVVVD